jgi:hypothetical protein
MNRAECIQRAVWALLSLVEQPADAVATAQAQAIEADLKPGEFRSMLRAAGAFARDEEGYFVRYKHGGTVHSLAIPTPTHLLSFPLPVEPRMRIAYSVFTGLLFKYLYQEYSTIPINVTDGLAQVWCPHNLPTADELWRTFRASSIVEDTVADGIEASLNALPRSIGALPLTDTLGHSAVWKTVRQVIPNRLTTNTFQMQGGKRLSFYWRREVLEGARAEPLEETVVAYLQGHLTLREAAGAMTAALLSDEEDGILQERGLWEAWQNCFKDLPEGAIKTKEEKARAKELKERGRGLDYGRLRRNAADLQMFVSRYCSRKPVFEELVSQAAIAINKVVADTKAKGGQLDLTQLLDGLEEAFVQESLTIPTGGKPANYRRQAVLLALETTLMVTLAKQLPEAPEGHRFTLWDWPVDLLTDLELSDAYVLTLLDAGQYHYE